MTQYATPATVLAPFDGIRLPVAEGVLQLQRRGDDFLVRAQLKKGAPVERRIGLLTGSHHMQAYWMTTPKGNALEMLPYMFLIEDRRWVPARDTFLADPKLPWTFTAWNDHCLQCHATAGQPRPGPAKDHRQTRVAEMGIACEACHGPGERHGADPDIPMVDPRNLPPRESSEVCGQCHGISLIPDWDHFLRDGFSYRPGASLAKTNPLAVSGDPNRFWPDGMVRVSGREWNGMVRSPCHQRGKLTCLSCHSMHESDPDDMIAPKKADDESCFSCHAPMRPRLAEHTHHEAASPGSRCGNCHMPHTTYGLLKAIRSHQIDSPSVATTLATGRLNACNLCHLDRPLAWTADHLTRWYGTPAVKMPDEERTVAAGVLSLLRGDAGQRALTAWHLGWAPARKAAGAEWMPTFLAMALGDTYAAVRYIAQRSLRATPELARVEYDYVAAPDRLERSVDRITAQWVRVRGPVAPDRAARLLMRPNGSLLGERVRDLLQRRDERSLDLKE